MRPSPTTSTLLHLILESKIRPTRPGRAPRGSMSFLPPGISQVFLPTHRDTLKKQPENSANSFQRKPGAPLTCAGRSGPNKTLFTLVLRNIPEHSGLIHNHDLCVIRKLRCAASTVRDMFLDQNFQSIRKLGSTKHSENLVVHARNRKGAGKPHAHSLSTPVCWQPWVETNVSPDNHN